MKYVLAAFLILYASVTALGAIVMKKLKRKTRIIMLSGCLCVLAFVVVWLITGGWQALLISGLVLVHIAAVFSGLDMHGKITRRITLSGL